MIVCGGCSGHAFKFGPLLGTADRRPGPGPAAAARGRPVPRVAAGGGVSLAIAEQVRGRDRTATEVLDEHLEKLAADELGAVWRITEERARREAAAVDRALAEGRDPGPLAGVPVGWKDLIDTGGTTTTYGSALFRDHVPDRDADVVARFAAAGAVTVAKLATHELAWGTTNQNPHFGSCKNPHDPTRVPGGSSGGSAAALAAGMVAAAPGTDTGGSIRCPASCCGDRRPEADLRPREPGRDPHALPDARPLRPDGPVGGRVRAPARGHGRRVAARSADDARAGRALDGGCGPGRRGAHRRGGRALLLRAHGPRHRGVGATRHRGAPRCRGARSSRSTCSGRPSSASPTRSRPRRRRRCGTFWPEHRADFGPDVRRDLEAAEGLLAVDSAITSQNRLEYRARMHESLVAARDRPRGEPGPGVHAAAHRRDRGAVRGRGGLRRDLRDVRAHPDLQHPRLARGQRARRVATTPTCPSASSWPRSPGGRATAWRPRRSSRPPRSDRGRRGGRGARAGRARRPRWRASSTGLRAPRRARDGSTSRSPRRGATPWRRGRRRASPSPGGIAAIRRVARSSRRIVPGASRTAESPSRPGCSRKWFVWTRTPRSSGVTKPGPAGETSTVQTAPPSSSVTIVIALDAETSAAGDELERRDGPVGLIQHAPAEHVDRDADRRAVVAVAEDVEQDGDAAVVHPDLADDAGLGQGLDAAAVGVLDRPDIQPSASSLCQSHVWIPSADPDAVIEPRQAMVEHSPADGGQQLGAGVQRPDRLDGEARAGRDALDLGPELGCVGGDAVEGLRPRSVGHIVAPEPVQGEEPRVDAGHEADPVALGEAERAAAVAGRGLGRVVPVDASREEHILARCARSSESTWAARSPTSR